MSDQSDVPPTDVWTIIYNAITTVLDRYGVKDAFRRGDYWQIDDDWGLMRLDVEINNLDLLRLDIMKELQAILAAYPQWAIKIQLDIPGREDWPFMGLLIAQDVIYDYLRRDILPEPFRETVFGIPGPTYEEYLAAKSGRGV